MQRRRGVASRHGRGWLAWLAPALLIAVGACQAPVSAPTNTGPAFTVAVLSDPQLHTFVRPPCDRRDAASDCNVNYSRAATSDQIAAALVLDQLTWPDSPRAASLGPAPLTTVLVNGDLTQYWLPEQKADFETLIDAPLRQRGDVAPLYGFGNHDVDDPAGNCRRYFPFDWNACSRDALRTFRGWLSQLEWIDLDPCSLAYSWDQLDVHFVQLHLVPGYERSFRTCYRQSTCSTLPVVPKLCGTNEQVLDAQPWLERDLERASAAGRRIVINMHVAHDTAEDGDYWTDAARQRFRRLVARHDVIAVFAGHVHYSYGLVGDFVLDAEPVRNAAGDPVPFFRSGSAEHGRFLAVSFGPDIMRVGVVSSVGGRPQLDRLLGEDGVYTFESRARVPYR